VTYIDYLNDFNQWLETNALPASSQLLYYKLLYVFNRAGWPEDVGVDNLRLMVMLDGASKTTVIRARDKLIACGFIDYYKGKKGAPNRYALSLRYKNDTENATVYATKNDTENATVSDTTNATHIKTKTKTNPPYSPPRGVRKGSQPNYQPEWFARFWALYPRRTNRVQAVKAWDKLKPDLALCRVMEDALRLQMQSPQWQDPQHIPHPSTWLNGERWNDELCSGPPAGRPSARRAGRIVVDENGEEVVVYD